MLRDPVDPDAGTEMGPDSRALTRPVPSPCTGTWVVLRSTYRIRAGDWLLGTRLVDHEALENFETFVYRQESVIEAQLLDTCTNGVHTEVLAPTAIAWRELRQRFVCYGGSCFGALITTGPWMAGIGVDLDGE